MYLQITVPWLKSYSKNQRSTKESITIDIEDFIAVKGI
jgi:hypothetical protein